jgi:ubiquinone biosynthesis protein UbiJ
VGFVVLAVFASSVGIAVVRWFLPTEQLRGRKVSGRDLAQALAEVQRRLSEVEQLQSRFGEVADVQTRLGELEERVDFAERLLAQQREAERLAPPKS